MRFVQRFQNYLGGLKEGNRVWLKKTNNEDLSVREVQVYIAEVVPGLPTKQDYRNAMLAAIQNTIEEANYLSINPFGRG